jgi:hypothetical protein
MPFELNLNPRRIALFLAILALYLAEQSLINEYLLENVLGPESNPLALSFLDLFSVNAEETIPTWYATLLLFLAAVLLAFIAASKSRSKAPYAAHWIGLSLIFLYLSMDEGAVIHEIFSDPLQARFNTSGYLTFAWVIVYVPLLIVFALLYLRFLFHLPPRTRNLFILAGLLYVGGAVVIEAISANRYSIDGVTFAYLAIATVEELCEMLGVVVFIYALLSYLSEAGTTAELHFAAPPPTAVSSFWRRLVVAGMGLIVLFNLALFLWISAQPPRTAAVDTIPFYQTVTERYEGQGVIILGINEVITLDNPAAPPIATSLLTLFEDVIIVNLPGSQTSIAFASQQLPFDRNTLAEIVRQSGETEFVVLETADLRGIADNIPVRP